MTAPACVRCRAPGAVRFLAGPMHVRCWAPSLSSSRRRAAQRRRDLRELMAVGARTIVGLSSGDRDVEAGSAWSLSTDVPVLPRNEGAVRGLRIHAPARVRESFLVDMLELNGEDLRIVAPAPLDAVCHPSVLPWSGVLRTIRMRVTNIAGHALPFSCSFSSADRT